eukprot:293342_1
MPPVNAQNGVVDRTDTKVNYDGGAGGATVDVRRRQFDDYDEVNLELQKEIASIPNVTKEALGNVIFRCWLLLSRLKTSSRSSWSITKDLRTMVSNRKVEMDALHLKLQNLQYEEGYLQREIRLCRDLATRELDKIREDEDDPDLLAGADSNNSQEAHQANLDRLQSELQSRQNLQASLKNLESQVSGLSKELDEKQQWAKELPDMVKEIEAASTPLRKFTSLDTSGHREMQRQSAELPLPLHILFCQLEGFINARSKVIDSAANDTKGDKMTLSIVKAIQYNTTQPASFFPVSVHTCPSKRALAITKQEAKRLKFRHDKFAGSENGDGLTAMEDETTDENPAVATLDTAAATGVGGQQQRIPNDLIKSFDAAVELTVKVSNKKGNNANTAVIRFQYMPELNIVTVQQMTKEPENLLCYLFPEDDGLHTPNLSNSHICVADGQDGMDGIHVGEGLNNTFTFPSDIPGRPYRWAQWLGGLCFSSAGRQPLEPSTRAVMDRIRARIIANTRLQGILADLQAKKMPSAHPSVKDDLPQITAVEVQTWKMMTSSSNHSIGGSGINSKPRQLGTRVFKLILSRGRNNIWGFTVEITPEYPLCPPVFYCRDGVHGTVSDSDARAVESEVNGHCGDIISRDVQSIDWLLAHRVIRCASCIDALSKGEMTGLGRNRKGRARRPPIKWDKASALYVHR